MSVKQGFCRVKVKMNTINIVESGLRQQVPGHTLPIRPGKKDGLSFYFNGMNIVNFANTKCFVP